MDHHIATNLLLSLQARNLIMFCGAGLSIPSPSDVPSARALANQYFDKYRILTGDTPPPPCRDDLELLTEYVFQHGRQADFIKVIVDWGQFRGTPNRGHIAIADFLACKAIHSAITTNFDELVEIAARSIISDRDFRAAFTARAANEFRPHNPLLKIHGCVTESDFTLWCRWQLLHRNPSPINREIRRRIRAFGLWLRGMLPGKDLVLVGFWSDWSHIDRILQLMLNTKMPRPARIVVVDILSKDELQEKAPALFSWAAKADVEYVRQSGSDFLDELRDRFSRRFFDEVLAAAVNDYRTETHDTKVLNTAFTNLINTDDMYSLRRDFWGLPADRPVRKAGLSGDLAPISAGVAHLLAREKGATLDGSHYIVNVAGTNKRVRIVTGHGRVISMIRREFEREPPNPKPEDFVICAGGRDDGSAKSDIVRNRSKRTILRPGSGSQWITLERARAMGIL